jgi:hypothetical protein
VAPAKDRGHGRRTAGTPPGPTVPVAPDGPADFDGLLPQHAFYLRSRAVTPQVANARGYRSAETKKALKELGFSDPQQRPPALVIPGFGLPVADGPTFHQIRPDSPRWNGENKPLKFELPPKSKLHLDVHPSVRHLVQDASAPLLLVEGVVKADSAVGHLGVCVIALLGVWAFRDSEGALPDWEYLALKSRDAIVVFDSDVVLKAAVHAALTRFGPFLEHRGARAHYAYLPSGDHGKPNGLDDWIATRRRVEPDLDPGKLLAELAGLCEDKPRNTGPKAPPAPKYDVPARRTLADVDHVFEQWLEDPDTGAVRLVAAAVAANRQAGDPVWLLVVAPPSSSKTEIILSICGPPDVHRFGGLTRAALLSGTPHREQLPGATGGLMRQVGKQGILASKDFGVVLAMKFEQRAEVLQDLRDVYDGRLDRPVGADGGRTLTWEGSCGFIAGVTEAIDTHHGVIAQLGDRFVMVRLELADPDKQARKAIGGVRDEAKMRAELAEAVGGLLGNVHGPWPDISEDARERLAGYAALVTRCRSMVERDRFSRDITSVPRAEQPARVAKQLAKLFAGLMYIGCTEDEAWPLLARVTLDSMPAVRRKALDHLYKHPDTTTSSVGAGIGLPTTTARRALEDLYCHEVLERSGGGKQQFKWRMTAKVQGSWPAVPANSPPPGPEKSVGTEPTGTAQREFAGTDPSGEPDEAPDQDEETEPGFEEAF